ncbi:MAG: histidine--tRNA ligase [Sphaerochaetaceae bacterium]|nr:histidine--tRNA ligase [Sphaerochaetaceae bacterium]MDC7237090.1 histidine--tRNA ligase [Sphaerochaetaceae bacterium]MDC7250141.1 histidine--tRNA ligase [Sphaerochaetaceae bacterium]
MSQKNKIIEPKVLKGFSDSLPKIEIQKRRIINKLEQLFSSYGFVPIDTPALEYTQVLLGKGGGETDKQIFHFEDNGGREVALRFDLTVPFARFLAANFNELAFPFKRYHINKVWRGEKPQKGRFREFYQCDFDIVGVDSSEADFEILSMMNHSFSKLGIKNFKFHVAHRGLFNAFLTHLDLLDNSVEILRAVDKLRKIGEDKVKEILIEISGDEKKAQLILDYIKYDENETFLQTLSRLSALSGGEVEHTTRMTEIYNYLDKADLSEHFILDPSITRGLDYYTGIVYETFLEDLPNFGSVCSGGRYNNLASLYTKNELPGVGSSIGLDRLLSALVELDSPLLKQSSSSDVIIFNKGSELYPIGTMLSAQLREKGLRVDSYLLNKKLPQQFKYAEKNSIPYGIMLNNETISENTFTLKNLETRETFDHISLEKAVEIIKGN